MSILNSIAMNSALHASNSQAAGLRITPEMGSGQHEGVGVLERDFVPCGHLGEIITFGSWPLEADGAPEPLQWRVIGERADGVKLAVTLDIIEQRGAHDFDGDVSWQFSSIRYWLHKVFMQYAFTESEKQRIPMVRLVTFDNADYCTVGCFGSDDRIFCLSHEEAGHFFLNDQARRAHRTGYTKRMPSLPCWWLRSPGGHQFAFEAVSERGAIDRNGFQATLRDIGVRPAILIAPEADRQVKDPTFCGYHSVVGPGYAIAYADEEAAKRELKKSNLSKQQPIFAVAGGYPSILLIRRLLAEELLDVKSQFEICKSAVHAHEYALFKHIVDQGTLGDYRLGQLLNACVSEGSIDLATYLVSKGASSEGYARAYLPSATAEATAVCAVAIDPAGAVLQWEHVRRYPAAVRQLVAAISDKDALRHQERETLLRLPDLLSVCAANGFLGEVYYLVGTDDHHFTAIQFAEAIQEAKFHNHTELTAYLIDRQAELFGSNASASLQVRQDGMRQTGTLEMAGTDTATERSAPSNAPADTPATPSQEPSGQQSRRPQLEL